MAKFTVQLPDKVIREMKKVHDNTEEIFGEMVEAGAKVVESNVRANLPKGMRDSAGLSRIKLTRVYRTPSDDGLNVKVGIWGYFTNSNGQRVPAPLVANVFEYGRSGKPFPKQPFFRKSFRKDQIEAAMLKAQKQASGGLLDE